MRTALMFLTGLLLIPLLAGCAATQRPHDAWTLAASARQPLPLPTTPPGGLARLPLFERLMQAPHNAGEQAGHIDTLFRANAGSPLALTQLTTRLAGIALARDASSFAADETRLLATALRWLDDSAGTQATGTLPAATDSGQCRVLRLPRRFAWRACVPAGARPGFGGVRHARGDGRRGGALRP